MAGSFGYVAPEVLTKTGHGKAVDLWSTGCVVLCAQFKGNSVLTVGTLRRWLDRLELLHTSFSVDTRRLDLKTPQSL